MKIRVLFIADFGPLGIPREANATIETNDYYAETITEVLENLGYDCPRKIRLYSPGRSFHYALRRA